MKTMKSILLAVGVLLAGYSLEAQTNNAAITNASLTTSLTGIPPAALPSASFFSGNTNRDWLLRPYGLESAGKWGGGVDIAYPVSDFVRTGIGAEWFGGSLYETSFNAQLGTSWQSPVGPVYTYLTTGLGYQVSSVTVGKVTTSATGIGIGGTGVEWQTPLKFTVLQKPVKFSIGGEFDHYTSLPKPVLKVGAVFNVKL